MTLLRGLYKILYNVKAHQKQTAENENENDKKKTKTNPETTSISMTLSQQRRVGISSAFTQMKSLAPVEVQLLRYSVVESALETASEAEKDSIKQVKQ